MTLNGSPLSELITIEQDNGLGIKDAKITELSVLDFVNSLNLYNLVINYNKNEKSEINIPIDVNIKFNGKPYTGPANIIKSGESSSINIVNGLIKINTGDVLTIENVEQGTYVELEITNLNDNYNISFPDPLRMEDTLVNKFVFEGEIQNIANPENPFSLINIKVTEKEQPQPSPEPKASTSSPKTFDMLGCTIIAITIITAISACIILIRKRRNNKTR